MLLKFYLIAFDSDHVTLIHFSFIWDYFEANRGFPGSANEVYYLIKPPADDVLDSTLITLTNPDNKIRRTQGPLLVCGSRGHQSNHFGELVINLKNGTDTIERQAHIDIKVLRSSRREIGCMGIVELGKGICVHRKYVSLIILIESIKLVLVSALEGGDDFLRRLVRKPQAQSLTFEALAPPVIKDITGFSPGQIFRIQRKIFVNREVKAIYLLLHGSQRGF